MSSEYSSKDDKRFQPQNWRDLKLDGTTATWNNDFPDTHTSKLRNQLHPHMPKLEDYTGEICIYIRNRMWI